MLAANQILQGRYRIIRQLGHGGMGAVYEAIDERFGEPIALKEILLELTGPDNEIQKISVLKAFEREAKALAKANHRTIPYVRDYFSELGRQFLVMELVEGDDLERSLKNLGNPFPLEDVLKWADQLLDALDYLHSLDPPIIHRDIKPQNLKLNSRGRIKLLDFGIAKSDNQTSTVTNQTFVGATLNYSPIEQILRVIDPMFREYVLLKHKAQGERILSQNTDLRCDIYALGATCYHLLTNNFPIGASKRALEIWEGKKDPLPNPGELNPEVTPEISDWLLKAMEIERDRRYSSATEMRKALSSAVGFERVSEELISEEFRRRLEERKSQDRFLTGAKTERLNINGEIKVDTDSTIYNETQSSINQAVTQASVAEPVSTDSALTETGFTEPSGEVFDSELTGVSYLREILPEKEELPPPPEPVSNKSEPVAEPEKFKMKYLWIGLIVLLAVPIFGGGVFAAMWWIFNQPPATNSNRSSNIITTPSVTPTPAPTVETPSPTPIETLTPTPTATPTATPTMTPLTTPTEHPQSSATPIKAGTPNRTPIAATTPHQTPVAQKTTRPCTYDEIIKAGEKKIKCN
jgi:serine/threonine protein kinase